MAGLCTYTTTGSTFISQPIWECLTCPIQGGEVLCANCLLSCHAQCETRQVSESARAYCDCGSRGETKCKGLKPPIRKAASVTPSVPTSANTKAPPAQQQLSSTSKPTSPGRPRSAQGTSASDANSSNHQRANSASAPVPRVPSSSAKSQASAAVTPATNVSLASLTAATLLKSAFALPSAFPTQPSSSSHALIPSECTYLSTGPNFTKQSIYACYTCGMFGDLAVCYYCIVRCHAHHKIAFVSDSKRSYCDCGSRHLSQPQPPPSVKSSTSPTGAAAPAPVPCQALVPLAYREAQALAFLCTLTQTGTNFHAQRVFHCQDCNIQDDEICCENCALVCHRGHRCEERGTIRAYCDCSANGLCQTLDIQSVVHARRSQASSHSGTPSIFNLSRRSSFGHGHATAQLELTDLSANNSAASSKKPSRRSSWINNASNHSSSSSGISAFDSAPEEKVDAMSTTDGVMVDLQNDVMTMKDLARGGSDSTEEHTSQITVDPSAETLHPHPPLDATSTATSTPAATNSSSTTSDSSPPSPRSIRTLMQALRPNPSLDDFLTALDLTQYRATFAEHEITDLQVLRDTLNERELETLIPKMGHRLKIKSALLSLRQLDIASPLRKSTSTDTTLSYSMPSLTLGSTTSRQLSDERNRRIYLAILKNILQDGSIRPKEEELLSLFRHQSHISFAQHQSVLHELGLDEASFEELKRKGTVQEATKDKVDVDAPSSSTTAISPCVICLSAPSTHILIPCGHVCLCENCVTKVMPPSTDDTPSSSAASTLTSSSSPPVDLPLTSPRLLDFSCFKCRAPVERIYRAFL